MTGLDPWYLENLVCPADRSRLELQGSFLVSKAGRRYPIVEGMPVMLRADVPQTLLAAERSLALATAIAEGKSKGDPPLYAYTLGVTDAERSIAEQLLQARAAYDPVVAIMVGATSGNAYKHLIGSTRPYPIPAFRFPSSKPGRLLDIGCNWGRWTVAAARGGHEAVGIDPQLGAILAARRVAAQLGVNARFVVGDARNLPFRDGAFDYAWSYSVLQHFSLGDAEAALKEVGRTVRPQGIARIQLANLLGIRSLFVLARRKFHRAAGFDVRYWTPGRMKAVFKVAIGTARLEADCFFGLGLQPSDFDYMNATGKCLLLASEALRRASRIFVPFSWFADSLFCTAVVSPRHDAAA